MGNIKQKLTILKNNWHQIVVPLILIVILLIYNFITPNSKDDVWFYNIIDQRGGLSLNNIFSYLGWRYNSWTSRLGIEFLLVIFVRVPVLFRLLNVGCSFLIFIMIKKIFNIFSKKTNVFIDLMLCLIIIIASIFMQNEAGITATCMNYLWPFSLSLISTYVIFALYNNKNLNYFFIIFSVAPLLLVSFWSEPVLIQMFILYICCFLYFLFFKKQINVYCIVCLILSFFFIIFIINCPGNKLRNQTEIERYAPFLANFSLMQKINRCIFSSFKGFYISSSVLLIFIIIYIFINKYNIYIRIISVSVLSLYICYLFTYLFARDVVAPATIVNWSINILILLIYTYFIYVFIILYKKNVRGIFISISLLLGSLGSISSAGFSALSNCSIRVTLPMFLSLMFFGIYMIKERFIEKKLQNKI